MRPQRDDLTQTGQFQLLTELGHLELMEFVRDYYWKQKTPITLAHHSISLLVFVVWLAIGFGQKLPFEKGVIEFSFACLTFLLVLPLHEIIHGLVYRAFGAKSVQIKGSLKGGYAYAIAPDFVVSRTEFAWVAIAPFLVINGTLLLLATLLEPYRFFLFGVLLLHTGGTSGDFAMLSYGWIHRKEEVYTFDDGDTRKSFFYARLQKGTRE